MSVFISNLVISPEFGYLDGKLYAFINKKLMVMGFSVTIRLLVRASVYTLLTSSLNGNAAYKIYSVGCGENLLPCNLYHLCLELPPMCV